MSDWNDDDAKVRAKAAYKFCEMLERQPELRAQCKANPLVAWETLKKAGDFHNIPGGVEVRVFEQEPESSDVLVTLVLPPSGQLPREELFDARAVWRCTWIPYEQLNAAAPETSSEGGTDIT